MRRNGHNQRAWRSDSAVAPTKWCGNGALQQRPSIPVVALDAVSPNHVRIRARDVTLAARFTYVRLPTCANDEPRHMRGPAPKGSHWKRCSWASCAGLNLRTAAHGSSREHITGMI